MFINIQAKKLAIMSMFAFASTVQSADFYQITDLGSLNTDSAVDETVEAFSINNANDIVGNSNGSNFNSHAFLFRDNQMNELGFLPLETTVAPIVIGNSFAFDINNNNMAVGFSSAKVIEDDPDTTDIDETGIASIAVYYDTNNLTINRIPQFDLETAREARGVSINDNGLVVGFANVNAPDDVDTDGNATDAIVTRGFTYNINSNELLMTGLPVDETFAHSVLRSINNNNYAVGLVADTVSNGVSTFIRSDVIGIDINNPGTVTKFEFFNGSQDQVWDINDQGILVGSANKSDEGAVRAISYDVNNLAIKELGVLNTNFPYSEALGINEVSQIVGSSQTQNSPSIFHAFLHENDTIKDLDQLIGCDTGWTLNKATSINDNGIIVGTGLLNGKKRAFMLSPLAGTAPSCNEESSSSGSLPLFGLLILSLLSFVRRASCKH